MVERDQGLGGRGGGREREREIGTTVGCCRENSKCAAVVAAWSRVTWAPLEAENDTGTDEAPWLGNMPEAFAKPTNIEKAIKGSITLAMLGRRRRPGRRRTTLHCRPVGHLRPHNTTIAVVAGSGVCTPGGYQRKKEEFFNVFVFEIVLPSTLSAWYWP